MAQPQLKADFINNLFGETKRKFLGEETKKEARQAVQAYLKAHPIKGLSILASFHIYFNEAEKAVELMRNSIAEHGDSYDYYNCLSIAYISLGDVDNQIKSDIRCLELNQKKIQFVDIKNSIRDAHLANIRAGARIFLYDSELVKATLESFKIEYKMNIFEYIKDKNEELSKLGISLVTYQKFTTIVHQVVNKYYVRGFSMALNLNAELDIAELAVGFDEISPQKAFELTNEIDDAVLTASIVDDVFAKEVRKLTVNCTLREEKEEEEFA